MPLRDSDIPMNVPFTFSNKQPLHSRGPPQRFKPTYLTIMRVQRQLHIENVACDVMCEHNCTLLECMNRVRTNLVRVAPSKLIPGEADLFACEDIERKVLSSRALVLRDNCGRERREHAPD